VLLLLAGVARADISPPEASQNAALIVGEGDEELLHPNAAPGACSERRSASGDSMLLRYRHDTAGRVVEKEDGIRNGIVAARTRYHYDTRGRLASLDGAGWHYEYQYFAEPRSRKALPTAERGGLEPSQGSRSIETWFWEPGHKRSGRVVIHRDSAGRVTHKEWDTDGDGKLEKITRYFYEGPRLVREWTETPQGLQHLWVKYFYDAEGRRIASEGTTESGPFWRTDYRYDPSGRLVGKRQSATNNPQLVFMEVEYSYACD
jgi:hypothetical protein